MVCKFMRKFSRFKAPASGAGDSASPLGERGWLSMMRILAGVFTVIAALSYYDDLGAMFRAFSEPPGRLSAAQNVAAATSGDEAPAATESGVRPAGATRASALALAKVDQSKQASKAHAKPTVDYWSMLFVLMLATFIGIGVIGRVSRLLHTPLMSLTNAISAIAVVGSIIVTGADYPLEIRILGAIALFASMTNIVSGFLITDRMLKMFKQERQETKS